MLTTWNELMPLRDTQHVVKFWLMTAAFFLSLFFLPPFAQAGSFLEMPDTTEVPELERDSLLLDLDVPAVQHRSPDPQAGPRLNVREFRVQGVVEYPELGIYRQELMDKVEAIRFDMMDEGEQLESGYTLDELASISDLIVEMEKESKGRHVGPLDVQRLVFHVREQRRQRGITLGMIEAVADTITRYYRERGFILAKAYIPQQRVRDGIVNLTVLLGDLGEVRVANNQHYRDKTITAIFDDVTGKPVKADLIEERLFLVNDLPGLRAQGFFEPGAQVGDSRMMVNVTDERWYSANLRMDNHGSESSGEYRLYGDFYWHNPLGIGDQLQLGVLNSFEPDNSLYGMVRYRTPVYFPRLSLSVGASNNDFIVSRARSEDLSALDISGRSRVLDAELAYQWRRSRVLNRSFHVAWAQIRSEMEFAQDEQFSFNINSTVENLSLTYRFDRLDEKRRMLHQASIGFTSSRFVEKSVQDTELDANPWIVPVDYTLLTFWRLPFTDTHTRVIARVAGQYAGTALSSINQFSLSGPRKARGYALNAFFADDGVYAGVDWIFPGAGPLKDSLQPMVFADYSWGVAREVLEGTGDAQGELSNVGVGLRLNYSNQLRGSISVAEPLSARNSSLVDGETPDEGTRVYFDLQYSF